MLGYLILGGLVLVMAAVTTYALAKNQELKANALASEIEADRRCAEAAADALNAKKDADRRCAESAADADRRCSLAEMDALNAQRDADRKCAEFAAQVDAVNEEIAKIEQFRHIPDVLKRAALTKQQAAATLEAAEEQASRIVQRAFDEAQAARERNGLAMTEAAENARGIASAAQAQADAIIAQARKDARDKAQKAEQALSMATADALEIAEKAEKQATEIGGKAYEALKNKEFYEKAAEAMRNVTKGYGDRYMDAGESVVDEWADRYGFSEAGEKLRLARDRVKLMGKNRTAATCDYAETVRRELAINFVLDAFNGKVESILARTRQDNYGKLRQEITDVFQLVNFNGKAFRDARITDGYLDARLDELKWSQAVQQLRSREREEQRAIQEQIRDEEKARKEYERAIKQAQRDEQVLTAAMEKTRRDFASAALSERGMFEAKLHDLEQKLKETEERNRRALSMAQQTRTGHVYIISNIGSFGEQIFKIGLTRRLEPLDRVRELGDASVPFYFDVHAMIPSDDAPALESALHRRFLQNQVNKVNRRKEFFRLDLAELRGVIDEMGLTAQWTITAEASEYRETLAMEDRMRSDPSSLERWVNEQAKNLHPALFDEEAFEAEVQSDPVGEAIAEDALGAAVGEG